MNNQGIQFGGPNIKRQINSAQISAGLHVPNSLNIVGMSSDENYDEDRQVHMWAESGFNVFGGINLVANRNPEADPKINEAKIQNPNGQLKMNNQGIQFGGPNNDREINSAQISAGLHTPDSLNIVGMASNNDGQTRKIEMWAEGGFKVNGRNILSEIDDIRKLLNMNQVGKLQARTDNDTTNYEFPLFYGINVIPLLQRSMQFSIVLPINQNLVKGVLPKLLVINPGFKATLYYAVHNELLRNEQPSFPSNNKNEWTQFMNPTSRLFMGIIVVKEEEPEPPREITIKYN